MFNTLSDRLGSIFEGLTRKGALTEKDVDSAMREVRRALLEADVALNIVRSFTDKVKHKAIGKAVINSVSPAQMVIKIVHDELISVLGSNAEPIDLNAPAPVAIMMVGLQGAGKTTTTAKIALRLQKQRNIKVLMASLDTRRPAAQEQLKVLGEQNDIATLPIIEGQDPVTISKRAMQMAKLNGFDAVLLDTAGRLHIDDELMQESVNVKKAAAPHEVLLVADALTGQDAVNVAQSFDERIGITGIVLTRVDGDGRGGAALSMRAVTGKPIKLLGVGEKADALEDFHPERLAGRILGMGDIVSLVEKASEEMDAAEARKIAQKLKKGSFDLDDLKDQLLQMQKLGGMGGIMGMLPGMGKIKKQMAASNVDDKVLMRQVAIIQSMTKKEKTNPKLLNASRKKRIAAGSGVEVQDVNRLIKSHRQMSDMMKKMGGKKGMKGMFDAMGGGADMGADMSPEAIEQAKAQLQAGQSPSLPSRGLPGLGGLGGGLGGLGGGLPGLGGPSQKVKIKRK